MSSAKSIGFIISETFSMSFIYKMKSNGPNMDPCGTPQEISLHSDSVLLNNNNNNILYLYTLSREETLFKCVYSGTSLICRLRTL